jgi:hypothetical protein
MIFYKHEKIPACQYRIGSRWDYMFDASPEAPRFAKSLTLKGFTADGQRHPDAVTFFEEPDRTWPIEFFKEHFRETKRTRQQALADRILRLDFVAHLQERNVFAEAAAVQAYLMDFVGLKQMDLKECLDILFAVLRAKDIGTAHIAGLDVGPYEPNELTVSRDYYWVIPQTNGEWQIIQNQFIANISVMHDFVSEREAKRIAKYYEGNCDYGTSYEARPVRQMALRTGNLDYNFIARTTGEFTLKIGFEAEGMKGYGLEGISLEEAHQVVWETYKMMAELGVTFTYDIS